MEKKHSNKVSIIFTAFYRKAVRFFSFPLKTKKEIFLQRTIYFSLMMLIFLLALFFILTLIFPLPALKPYSKVVYDRNGEFLQAFLTDDGLWRLRTSPDEIPDKLKNIILFKEDKYFYYHPGINTFSILRAFAGNIFTGKRISGASTITMQVARMLERRERTYGNKLIEIFRALQLEMHYSKNEILEIYLSILPLGGNIEGLKSASMIYYQTPPERLNISQLFDLMIIPNNPNNLRPDRNPDRLYKERIITAQHFLNRKYISKQDSVIIWNTESRVKRKSLPVYAPHFTQRVRNMSDKTDLVFSTLDLNLQQKIEMLLSNHIREWRYKGIHNGALLVIDNKTGDVVAYAGSSDFYDAASSGQVDAVRAIRSPGSTLKPFLYSLLIKDGELTPKMRLLDVPYDMEGFYAENYDGTFSGLVFADEALKSSLNVPMIRLLKEKGVNEFLDFLDECRFNSLKPQRKRLGLSMILGGCGVTLEELTAAYSIFPSEGKYRKPNYILTNKNNDGIEIIPSSTAFMVTKMLSGIERTDIPVHYRSSFFLPVIAFKTGTSYGRKDAWSIGYSSQYTVGVWIGDAKGKGNPELSGFAAAAPLLFDILNSISSFGTKEIIAEPPDIAKREVCAASGMVPSSNCPRTIVDYYSKSYTGHQFCSLHKEIFLSLDEKVHYCNSCIDNHLYKTKVFEDYSAELLSFWGKSGKHVLELPPHYRECSRIFSGEGPKILSPSDEMTYYLFSKEQKIVFNATSPVDVTEHLWYLNNKYIEKSKADKKLYLNLDAGNYKLICIDDKGRSSNIKFKVVLN